MSGWRLILHGAGEGAWNMAVDRALLDAHAAGSAPPTLRLYWWDRPTVSLGHFQREWDVDAGYCGERGIAGCRRPTGGRGVLHDHEVTYSVVAGVRDGVPRGVTASYRWLSAGLVEAYRRLGLDAALTARDRGERGAGACYLHTTRSDLSLGEAKLSGSAQVWNGESCLQHGSLVITRDVEAEAGVFGLDGARRRALADSTATIAGILGGTVDREEVAESLVEGFGAALGARFAASEIGSVEVEAARAAVDEYRLGW